MRAYCEMMKKNDTFYKATDLCTTYLIRMVVSNKYLAKWAVDNKAEYNWTVKWIKDNMTPPSPYTAGKVKTYKGIVSEYATTTFPGREKLLDRINKINTIIRGGTLYAELIDSDEDLSEVTSLTVGSLVYIEDSKDWLKGRVVRTVGNILEVANVEKPEKPHKWVDLESEHVVSSRYN
jgi:hypothetical protein